MTHHLILSCTAVFLLSACGGSGGSGGNDVVTLEELQARSETYNAAIGADNFEDVDPTDFADLPETGAFDYTGIAVVGIEAEGENDDNLFAAIGSATFTANFDDQDISGSADNFFQLTDPNVTNFEDLEGVRIAGSLTYNFDQVAEGENNYAGQVTGSLTPTNLPVLDVDIAGGGAFAGETGDAFFAEIFNDETDYFIGILATRNP